MNCLKCGANNITGSSFCVKCGANLNEMQQTVLNNNAPIQGEQQINVQPVQQPVQATVQNVNNQTQQTTQQMTQATIQTPNQINNNQTNGKMKFTEYFILLFAIILKPYTIFKEELNKFSNFKNSIILSIIISITSTILNLFKVMLNVVRVKEFSWDSQEITTKWVWENLKELKYMEIVGKNFLIYLGIIFAIATIYYIASLIIKKQLNFSKLLGISAIAVVPVLLSTLILSPILGLIWVKLSMPVTIIGIIYSVLIMYEGINNEVLIEGNTKFYFNLICMSILGIGLYYLYTKMFVSTVSSSLENVMNMFG